MAHKAFCVHGHFYQPPREDPLTGKIPLEQGAAPYRNWNERIHAQCYRPNAELGNFEHISFDAGPTLLQWMAVFEPSTLAMIVSQERRVYERYGVGNGMALAYNHTILPLASRQDKMTQVLWGIGDFEFRFGHKPNGMWLPEAAVDMETLQVLAECGIEFTILAPWQAKTSPVDTSQPYRVELPEGREITVFFYNQELSMRVSFDPGVSVNGDLFVSQSLLSQYNGNGRLNGKKDQLQIIASDGELYGHHQPFRDKFLAYILNGALKRKSLKTTFPALWLRDHPPKQTIEIRDNTSWSCHHGVTRWMGSCDCTPHGEWKADLRTALNRIAEAVDAQYLSTLAPYVDDPWQLRNEYIEVLCHRKTQLEPVGSHARQQPDPEALKQIEFMLAAQYERQRIFTSCGWFFDDFDRIEPRNNVAYAAHAVWLTYLGSGVDLRAEAAQWLAPVQSWRTGLRGDSVFNDRMECARRFLTVDKQAQSV